jgi:3-oxoacyl-[acyl-carrier protein] reductase
MIDLTTMHFNAERDNLSYSQRPGAAGLVGGTIMGGNGKVALVTGASRGIGAQVAKRLAADGFRIVLNYAGNADAAQGVAREIIGTGGEALVVQADVGDSTSVTALFDRSIEALGGIDVVVNNAGVMTLAPIAELSDEIVDQTIRTNLTGTFNICREAARRLADGGRIINFSSSVIGMRLPSYGIYAATKGAVEVLTQILAQEMRGRGIRVNAVAPGPVATELFLKDKSEELVERIAKLNPLERLGQTEDIARVVSFLAGPDGAWINGQVVRANGGMC